MRCYKILCDMVIVTCNVKSYYCKCRPEFVPGVVILLWNLLVICVVTVQCVIKVAHIIVIVVIIADEVVGDDVIVVFIIVPMMGIYC